MDTLKLSMVVAELKGSPSDISQAYTQLCEINKKECDNIYNEYDEAYIRAKAKQKENRAWIKKTGFVLAVLAAAFGGAYAGASAANSKKKHVSCSTFGNTTYCDEY